MVESYIQLPQDSAGKKVKTFDTGVAHIQAVTVTDSSGTEISPATEGSLSSIDDKITICNTGAVTVSALPSLPAGSNTIGKLATNDGVDIGNVDIASIAAGNNNIGDVDIASIAAGSNIIGNVRIDQTTPGTTNRVDIGAALPSGTNTIGTVSLGTSTGKTVVMKTGNLVTTAVTADQVVLTYTVTAGKTFYMEYLRIDTRLTTFATTATYFGAASLENPASTKLLTQMQAGAGITNMPPVGFAEPIPIAAGTVVRVVCTPSSTTSYTWQANFGGYEK